MLEVCSSLTTLNIAGVSALLDPAERVCIIGLMRYVSDPRKLPGMCCFSPFFRWQTLETRFFLGDLL